MAIPDLKEKKVFLFDLDGVFYKGKEKRVKLGGTEIVNALRARGKKIYVLTNNSTDTVAKLASNLRAFDIPVRRDEILTSTLLTARFLSKKYGRASYFLVGETGMDRELQRHGHRRVEGLKADVVAIGLDRFLTYEKLDHATRVGNNGADLVASHAAKVYMSGEGAALGPGATVKALEFSTGKRAVSIGKPSPLMFKLALEMAGYRPQDAVMAGDQLDTDVAGAAKAGIDSVLVLTGVDRSTMGSTAMGAVRNVDELTKYV
ncbi:MAG TPA: HAD-IIA family hydrolase [Nitrososphaerales archaeon]|nr:HAD-IIA family hydrolase [Nitrososphaerales archaeon]